MPNSTPALRVDRLQASLDVVGWTQYQLAHEAGIATNTISNIMTGKHEPTLSKMVAIADALGVSLDWLTGRDEYFVKSQVDT